MLMPFICLYSIPFNKGHILLFFEMKSRQKSWPKYTVNTILCDNEDY